MFYYTIEVEIKQKKKVVAHRRIDVEGHNLHTAKFNSKVALEEYVNEWFYPGTYKFVYSRRWLRNEGVPKKLGNIYK